MVFGKLLLRDCVAVSHICAYWRWLAVNDPLLWTALAGSHARIPVLYARVGSTTAIDVQLDLRGDALDDIVSCISGYRPHEEYPTDYRRRSPRTSRGMEESVGLAQKPRTVLTASYPRLSRSLPEGRHPGFVNLCFLGYSYPTSRSYQPRLCPLPTGVQPVTVTFNCPFAIYKRYCGRVRL
ncbi:hypothetical protein EXIGLDRAFT_113359 [Exidia glandulosa HHB12029]|uniref:F-box domain-containing protein n=1 Tax=Exidia glandulosa HHB12029 TaxID=1314781 RepID=A0A165GMP9_EXIGL|nr:hypothetical protein EXIGLDRAFT_113359 [Exidia glandulosa HHB12029]